MQYGEGNCVGKENGVSLCSAQTVYLTTSEGHLPVIKEELNSIITRLCWLYPGGVT